jgi:menaquinone-specific isochorismate synthase
MTTALEGPPIREAGEIRARLQSEIRQRHAAGAGSPDLLRVEFVIPPINALTWLCGQTPGSRGYWSDRDDRFELAGVGRADMLTGDGGEDYEALMADLHGRLDRADGPVRYFGGMRFSLQGRRDEGWASFKAYRFILPRFEILRRDGQTRIACNFRAVEPLPRVEEELARLAFPREAAAGQRPRRLAREDEPDAAGWRERVEAALAAFVPGEYEKVVLARKTRLRFDQPFTAVSLLRDLKPMTPSRFHFCFQPAAGVAFIGASPERLFHRRGRELYSEAIAGTRPRGAREDEDQRLAGELLGHEKERREHAHVVHAIRRALQELAATVESSPEPVILKLTQGQHLLTSFQARLKDGIRDGDILRVLHPTPAVGGAPTACALEDIARWEPFDRGWYAGPVGWLSRDETEFAVAIRSALVRENVVDVFAGAGLVAGSAADEEWDEVENKMADFFDALQVPRT